jgi:hypothetical protein
MNEANLSYALWIKYASPDNERSVAKEIPLKYEDDIKKLWPGKFRIRYRGPRFGNHYDAKKETARCFSVYTK